MGQKGIESTTGVVENVIPGRCAGGDEARISIRKEGRREQTVVIPVKRETEGNRRCGMKLSKGNSGRCVKPVREYKEEVSEKADTVCRSDRDKKLEADLVEPIGKHPRTFRKEGESMV